MKSFPLTDSAALADLVCRSALPMDTPAILDLTRHIWNGHDYIPVVWQDWLADAEGFLAVAEYGRRIVGMGKLTRLEEDEWWLEGLRVHPDFEGRGFATHIHRYLMQRWQALGKGVIRLATASKRIAVHRICAKLGFQKVAEFSAYEKRTETGGETAHFTPIQPEEVEIALDLALASDLLPLCFHLIDLGWQWARPRLSYLQRRIAAGQAYWWRGRSGLLCVDENKEDELKSQLICWVACALQDLTEFLVDFAQFAAQSGYQKAAWIAPLQPPVQRALGHAGYGAAWDFSLYIFEYRPAAPYRRP